MPNPALRRLEDGSLVAKCRKQLHQSPGILALLPRIESTHDPDLDRGGAATRHAVRIQAVLKDAATLSAYIEQRRGSIDHPLSATKITQNFRRLAETSRSEAEIDELIETISRLETQPGLLRQIVIRICDAL